VKPLALSLFTAGDTVATTPEVDALLALDAPVAIGVSGGKDSCAVAFAVAEQLDRVGHAGPRLLIHSDLGRTEWRASLPHCELLADRLGWPLLVVRREAGDMLARWQTRWANNVARYASLSCVKLILPWSTPAMRFCTSELKSAVIARALSRRFAGRHVLSVTGVRAQESTARAKRPVSAPNARIANARLGTAGTDWHAIHHWTADDVFGSLRRRGFPLHEAYATYGSSRVSCAYCILANRTDLAAAASCEGNADLYRAMVDLEVASTFAFQDGGWLADVAPHLLTPEVRVNVQRAKPRAAARVVAESLIPDHLLYTAGWPTCLPTAGEADLIAGVRSEVAAMVGLGGVGYRDGPAVLAR